MWGADFHGCFFGAVKYGCGQKYVTKNMNTKLEIHKFLCTWKCNVMKTKTFYAYENNGFHSERNSEAFNYRMLKFSYEQKCDKK